MYTKENCVSEFMRRLHIEDRMTTNPDKFNIALQNMYLDDFKYSQEIYSQYLNESVNLNHLFITIENSIQSRHPALIQFLLRALESNLIKDTIYLLPQIEVAIYNIVILEELTQRMYKDVLFMLEIKEHYLSKRENALQEKRNTFRYYLKTNKILGNLFEILKTLTMDHVYDQYIEFRLKKKLNNFDLFKKRLGLTLNIMEALFTDFFQGFFSSSYAALKLMVNQMQKIYLVENTNIIKQVFKKNWTNLYETWNMAFCTKNIKYLNFLYPKLLIPSVINAEEDDYLINRGLSLWITISVFFLKKMNKDEDDSELPNIKEIVKLWDKINLEYLKTIGF